MPALEAHLNRVCVCRGTLLQILVLKPITWLLDCELLADWHLGEVGDLRSIILHLLEDYLAS